MSNEIAVALIALFGTLAGSAGGVLASSRLTNFRLQKLEGSAGKCQKICVHTGETRGSSDLSGIYGSREGCVPAA